MFGIFAISFGVGLRMVTNSPPEALQGSLIQPDVPVNVAPTAAPPEEKPPEHLLLFVGDIMLDRGVQYKVERVGGGDFRFPFLKVANVTRAADVLFGNLEGPLSDRGREVGNLYSFRMPPEGLVGLTYAGFDVLSLANNHIGDWGRAALEDTALRLKSGGIAPVGVRGEGGAGGQPVVIKVGTAKIAFLAFSDFEDQYKRSDVASLIAFAREREVSAAIEEARTVADLIVVSFHWGDEYLKDPTARQLSLAHLAIDAGADLVVGSHPHVLQPLEEYHGGYIAYSLGNFVFDQNFSLDTTTGGVLAVTVVGNRITNVDLHPVRINADFQVEIE